jgi:epoxide hydrolase-like predicted phosphatase
MSIQAVIWDLGGVLVRTEDRGPRTRLAEQFGLTYEQMEAVVFDRPTARQASVGEITARHHWEEVCSYLQRPIEDLPQIKTSFFAGDRLDSQLISMIYSLRPRYKTGLLSNAFSDLREEYIERSWKFQDAFDEMIISAEVGIAKPDPHIYLLALQRLHVLPHEALFVDDFIQNVEGACSVGMLGIHFRNVTQAWSEVEQSLAIS